MKEKIIFFINEIENLQKNFEENWELILRYLVKINSILSDKSISDINLICFTIKELDDKIKVKELRTIINIYFSQIFYNRADKIYPELFLGEQNFKNIPNFVDQNKLKVHLYKKDEKFKEKGINIRGGWLDIKSVNSFTFNV